MIGTRRGDGRWAMLAGILLVVVSCGSPSASVPPASPGPVASAGPASPSPSGTAVGSAGALAAATSAATTGEVAVRELEDAAIAGVVDRSGLEASLGAGSWAGFEAWMREAVAGATSTAPGTGARPRTASTTAFLPMTAEGGAGAIGPALALGMVAATLMTGSPAIAGESTPISETREFTEGGNRMVGTLTGSLGLSTSGARISATVDITLDIQVDDAATGAFLGTRTFRSAGTVELDLCPDVNGEIRGRMTMDVSGGATGLPSARGATASGATDVVVHVGEDAYAHSVDLDGTASDTAAGPDGSVGETAVTGGGTMTMTQPGDVSTMTPGDAHGTVTRDTAGVPDAAVTALYERIGRLGGTVAGMVVSLAQERWRTGACVEIEATESSRKVRPNETVQFTAWPNHKVEGRRLDKPTVATFSGERSAEPLDEPHRPEILVSYKAPAERNHGGTVTLTSTSNRGIGTLDITFTVELEGWHIDQPFSRPPASGRITGNKCGDIDGEWIADGTYEVMGMKGKQHWVVTIDQASMTGKYTYTDRLKGKPAGAPVTVTVDGAAAGTVTLDLEPDGRVVMHLAETFHEYNSTTDLGGMGWENASLARFDMTWDVGAECP